MPFEAEKEETHMLRLSRAVDGFANTKRRTAHVRMPSTCRRTTFGVPVSVPSHSLTARREAHIDARRAARIVPGVVAAGPRCASRRTREPGSCPAVNTTALRARFVVVLALLAFAVLGAPWSAFAACVV